MFFLDIISNYEKKTSSVKVVKVEYQDHCKSSLACTGHMNFT